MEQQHPMAITGFILLLLGLITFTPEIYLSGILVMFISATLQLKYLESTREEAQFNPTQNTSYPYDYYSS